MKLFIFPVVIAERDFFSVFGCDLRGFPSCNRSAIAAGSQFASGVCTIVTKMIMSTVIIYKIYLSKVIGSHVVRYREFDILVAYKERVELIIFRGFKLEFSRYA